MAIANATLTDSAADIFTCSNAGGSAVVAIIFHNTDSSAQTVTLHVCPGNEAQANENKILAVSVPAGESYVVNDKLLLSNTDTLTALAGTTSVVSATISYLDL